MTAYILCGGADRNNPDFGEKLFDEVKRRVDKIRLADIYFASEAKDMRSRFDDYSPWFEQNFPDIERRFADKENIAEVIDWANVIFVHGGRTTELISNLEIAPDFNKDIQDKIYIGSSAGANYVSQHFLRHEGIGTGASLLPINVVVHYESDDPAESRSEERAAELESLYPEVETARIKEGEFVVIENE